jgi:hypothetical protein
LDYAGSGIADSWLLFSCPLGFSPPSFCHSYLFLRGNVVLVCIWFSFRSFFMQSLVFSVIICIHVWLVPRELCLA